MSARQDYRGHIAVGLLQYLGDQTLRQPARTDTISEKHVAEAKYRDI